MTREQIQEQINLLKELIANPKRVQTDSGSVEQQDVDPLKALAKIQALQSQLDALDSPTGRLEVRIARHKD